MAYIATDGNPPTVVFLGGFASDMQGTKATYLEERCKTRGQGFLRFDYSGHGSSKGDFKDQTIGSWLSDALSIVDEVTKGPLIMVGSSMGGWIGLLAALKRPDRVKGFVGIAAAPDFTQSMVDDHLTEDQKQDMQEKGFCLLPNDYGDPYIITQKLVEEAQNWMMLHDTIDLNIPVHLVQGMKDEEVEWQTAHRIKNALAGEDIEVFLIEEGDHRLSDDKSLELIDQQIVKLSS